MKGILEEVELLSREEGLSKDSIFDAIEQTLITAARKDYGTEEVKAEVNRETGSFKVYLLKTVVEEVEDEANQILLADARKLRKGYGLGDVCQIEVVPKSLHRIAVHNGTQVATQKFREGVSGIRFDEFRGKEGELVTGTILQIDTRNRKCIIDIGRVQAVLPYTEQIHSETYRQNMRLKLFVTEVRKTPKELVITVSRKNPGLIKCLFESEVPEIAEGIVRIKSIAREAGSRAKIAVYSKDEQVDPRGACIGTAGARVGAVVEELGGEKMDVVVYDPNPGKFIAAALSPAKVDRVIMAETGKNATVVVPDDQLTNAIGTGGQNARLAAKLTGYRIDIKSETQMGQLDDDDDDLDISSLLGGDDDDELVIQLGDDDE